jgi:hypothetical protein
MSRAIGLSATTFSPRRKECANVSETKKAAAYNRDADPNYHAGLLDELASSRYAGRDNVPDIIAELGRCGVEVPPAKAEDETEDDDETEGDDTTEEPEVDEDAGRRTTTTRGGRQRR